MCLSILYFYFITKEKIAQSFTYPHKDVYKLCVNDKKCWFIAVDCVNKVIHTRIFVENVERFLAKLKPNSI
ncbi:hypothetical protein GCM10008986_04940 [Salinibacillus aidingensis]|uniref:Transposase n=1 Tax=Salinibacillus aidingensis TaxID=237684 RepID=A0ABN1ASH7_9BACI